MRYKLKKDYFIVSLGFNIMPLPYAMRKLLKIVMRKFEGELTSHVIGRIG